MAIRPPGIAAALLVALFAPPASALYDEGNNRVTWPFEATVESIEGFGGCCTILVSVGQRASGELRFDSNPTGGETFFSFSMQLDGGPSTVGGGSGYLLQRGPGAPDQIFAEGLFSDAEGFVTGLPTNFNTILSNFAVIDVDGVAFDGLVSPPDPDLPPVFAPDAALFETRRIQLYWDFFGDPDLGTIVIRIDSLPVPEPGAGGLAGLGMAALALARRVMRR